MRFREFEAQSVNITYSLRGKKLYNHGCTYGVIAGSIAEQSYEFRVWAC